VTVSEAILREPKVEGERATARLSIDDDHFDLYYETVGVPALGRPDAFVVAALIPAMALGANLFVEGAPSARFMSTLADAQSILNFWDPRLQKIEVRSEGTEERSRVRGVGVFFSLGVDSFFTLKENKDDLTHLIWARGFDTGTLPERMWDEMFANVTRVARSCDKELLVVNTNVRELAEGRVSWKWFHGAGLASVGHALANAVGEVQISASQTYDHLGAWGSHPLLDHLWSSEGLEVRHAKATHNRVEKTLEIADDPLVQETLRVCFSLDGKDYNCGRCSKCLGVMLSLESIDRLQDFKTFPKEIDIEAIGDLNLNVGNRIYYFRLALERLRANGRDPRLIKALERRLRLSRLKATRAGAVLGHANDRLGSPLSPLRKRGLDA
jgi:hypothetical protein